MWPSSGNDLESTCMPGVLINFLGIRVQMSESAGNAVYLWQIFFTGSIKSYGIHYLSLHIPNETDYDNYDRIGVVSVFSDCEHVVG